jgi:hypothetical protein
VGIIQAEIMAAIGNYLTPSFSGKVLLNLSGYMANNTPNQGAMAQLRWGTGTKPSIGATVAGTVVGGMAFTASYIANAPSPVNLAAIITGLTVGTRYWFDVSCGVSGGSGQAKLYSCAMCAAEIP